MPLHRPGNRAEPAYEHLRYQQALQDWLQAQGYHPTLEKQLGADGRTDLHVVVDEVSHAIEVQLSPLPAAAWRLRDERYRRHAQHVTWLYGRSAEAASANELSVRGLSLALRPGPEIGVRDVDDHTQWVALLDCRLTADGFVVPGLQDLARDLRARRQAERQQERRERADRDERRRLAEGERRRDLQARRTAAAAREPQTRPRPIGSSTGLTGLEQWEARNPELAYWRPAGGWGWLDALPAENHRAARALAYTTQVLVFSSPIATVLPELDYDVRSRVLDVLEELSLIHRTLRAGGIERWERS